MTNTTRDGFADALIDLARARVARENAESDMIEAVLTAREQGASWAQIGRTLGISRQLAHNRYGR